MKQNRRHFIRTSGLTALAGVAGIESIFASMIKKNQPQKGLQLTFIPYDLKLQHTFTLANSSRTHTPDVLTCIEFDGLRGYGEASMPPYLGESVESATRFLSSLNLNQFNDPFQLDEILEYVDKMA